MREKLLSDWLLSLLPDYLEKSHKLEIRGDFFNHFPTNIGTQHYSLVLKDLFNLHFSDWMSAVFKGQFLLCKYNFQPYLEVKQIFCAEDNF